MTLPQLPADKANHVLLGLAVFVPVAFVFSPIWGLVAAIAVGAAKEYWDARGHGCVEFWDFAATAGGGLVGYGCTRI